MKTIQKIGAFVATTSLFFLFSAFTKNSCPIITYNGQVDGAITVDDFKQTKALSFASQKGFGNDDAAQNCELVGYTMYYIGKDIDPVEIRGNQPTFQGVALKAINQAKSGDTYVFVDVQAKCDGETKAKKVNSIALKIK